MKAVIILSGGMDSTTLLYDLVNQKDQVHAITFDYNQKHKTEIACAKKICKELQVPHKVVDISVLNDLAPSSLTRAHWEVPEGNYAEDSMKQTVVPNREHGLFESCSFVCHWNRSEPSFLRGSLRGSCHLSGLSPGVRQRNGDCLSSL